MLIKFKKIIIWCLNILARIPLCRALLRYLSQFFPRWQFAIHRIIERAAKGHSDQPFVYPFHAFYLDAYTQQGLSTRAQHIKAMIEQSSSKDHHS